ncbi:hypothetical protein Tco_0988392 [Tanacetum coccineum]|uniref:Uncharacterized protein n=1 Tax=Tanacetum coccineum TaxID=301880 RepID=A0ABQ5EQW0_9ASTR
MWTGPQPPPPRVRTDVICASEARRNRGYFSVRLAIVRAASTRGGVKKRFRLSTTPVLFRCSSSGRFLSNSSFACMHEEIFKKVPCLCSVRMLLLEHEVLYWTSSEEINEELQVVSSIGPQEVIPKYIGSSPLTFPRNISVSINAFYCVLDHHKSLL